MINVFGASLVSDVAAYRLGRAVARDRRDVVAVGPKLAPPEFFLDRGDECEYLFRCRAFHEPHDLASGVFREESAEYVEVVLVESDLADVDGVSFLVSCHLRFDDPLYFLAEERLPILHCQLDVVVAFRDVVVPIPDISFLASSGHQRLFYTALTLWQRPQGVNFH